MTDDALHRRVCAVCGRVLDRRGHVWFHGVAIAEDPDVRDHVAIPVRDDEVLPGHIQAKCDFCFADDPAFILPARSFTVNAMSGSDGDWAACGNCAECIERNDWSGLVRRAQTGYEARHGMTMDPEVVQALRGMYRRLRKNITGALRLDPDYPNR